MVHSNNCTSDLNAWVSIFEEFSKTIGMELTKEELYETPYTKALEGDEDGGGLLSYNYFSGEHITGLKQGRPLFVRRPDSEFNLANFMRDHLYSAISTLKIGLDTLMENESMKLDDILGHGDFFITEKVG